MASIKATDLIFTSDELYEHQSILVDPGQAPVRIDKFLMDRLDKVSRNRIQNAIKAGCILVNDNSVKANYKTKPRDRISVVLPSEPHLDDSVKPENIPLDIVYEDEYLMVIDKKAGMVVHPGTGNSSGTLVNALMYHFQNRDLPVMKGNSADRPGLVHRIDKDTSGLLIIAKQEIAMTHLARQFFDHSIEREYVALVWGDVEEDKGTIEGHIGRHEKDRMLMTVYSDGSQGKHAITHYEVLKRMYYVTLVKCRLETGRTHQIRVHMRYMGHTLFNDARYGGNSILKGTIYSKYRQFVDNCFNVMPRQALHARTLGFIHPVTEKKLYFESPLPDDFRALIDKWENYVEARKKLIENESE
jgi:23S rRNA pseudouridine1911/1915/1917 synthase